MITPCPASPTNRSPERWRSRSTLTSSAPMSLARTAAEARWNGLGRRAAAAGAPCARTNVSRSVKPIGRSAAAASMRRSAGSAASAGSASRGMRADTTSPARAPMRAPARRSAASPPGPSRASAPMEGRPSGPGSSAAKPGSTSAAEGRAPSGAARRGAASGLAAGGTPAVATERRAKRRAGSKRCVSWAEALPPASRRSAAARHADRRRRLGTRMGSGLPGIEAERQVVGGTTVDRVRRPVELIERVLVLAGAGGGLADGAEEGAHGVRPQQDVGARVRLLAAGLDDERDEVRFARDVPDVRRLAEQLVRRLQVGVHEADELLDLAVRRFLPLPAVAAAERLRGVGGAAFSGTPENLAHVCVDAQDQRYGVERDAHGPSSVPWRCAGRHASAGRLALPGPPWLAPQRVGCDYAGAKDGVPKGCASTEARDAERNDARCADPGGSARCLQRLS